jgi:hypothetical protein
VGATSIDVARPTAIVLFAVMEVLQALIVTS